MELKEGRLVFRAGGRCVERSFSLGQQVVVGDDVEIVSERLAVEGGEIWRVRLRASQRIVLDKIEMVLGHAFAVSEHILINGFQSWTNSREFRIDERLPGLPPLLRPLYARHKLDGYGDYSFHRYSGSTGVFHGYTYSYVRSSPHKIWFAGSLSEAAGYTVFDYDTGRGCLMIGKECRDLSIQGEWRAFDLFVGEGEDQRVFDRYFLEMGVAAPRASTTPGWTSWYNYYTNISEEIILSNAREFSKRKVPISIFQIDDGYQTAVGDWLSIKPAFPNGMKAVAQGIQSLGFKAGLWLAPFICEEKSSLLREHPEWILREKSGKPFVVGNNDLWSGLFYALDIYHPGVRDYLSRVFEMVLQTWGFDMVKLDFLHAGGILPREDKTRGQVMCEGMDLLRQLCGDKLILGCGVPLGPAFGKVDYCRVGPDVHLEWEEANAAKVHYRERISTINSIGNAIGRRHLNGRAFISDPDVFILRSGNNRLSDAQKRTLFLTNCIFGDLLFMSDFLGDYSEPEMKRYLSLYPLAPRKILSLVSWDDVYRWTECSAIGQLVNGVRPYANLYAVEFEVEASSGVRRYWAVLNLGDKEISVDIPEGSYWDGERAWDGGARLTIEPFASRCLYKRSGNGSNEVLGGPNHIFPGCDAI